MLSASDTTARGDAHGRRSMGAGPHHTQRPQKAQDPRRWVGDADLVHVPVSAIEVRDLLDDLDAVVGSDRVRLADVPALLRDLAPTWGPYRALTGVQLRDLLDDGGVRTTNVANVPRPLL